MSKSIELPDSVYDALIDAAQASGTTPIDWIAARVSAPTNGLRGNGSHPPATLGDLLKNKIGVYRSGKPSKTSERAKELFGECLEQKRQERLR